MSYENYTFPINDGGVSQILSTDGNGQLSWTSPSIGNGAFEKNGNLVRQVTNIDNDNFIFGRATLPSSGSITDKFFFYDQLTSSFRGGNLSNSNNWNIRGVSSFGYGDNVDASGDRSAAFGLATSAIGENTFTVGEKTKADAINSVAIGRFNIGGGSATSWIESDPLFEVGNGSSDGLRDNAVTVLKNGNVGIGTNNPLSQIHQSFNSTPSHAHIKLTEEGPDGARIILENNQNTNFWTVFGRPNESVSSSQVNFHFTDMVGDTATGNKFRIYGSGDAWLKGTLTSPSDITLKTNIESINGATMIIQALSGYKYNWKTDEKGSQKQIGVIAQEVQRVLPEIVRTDEDGFLSVSYSSLVPVLIEGMKEQQEKIDSVLEENQMLKDEIEKIKAFLKI